jgi:hypothetical protein
MKSKTFTITIYLKSGNSFSFDAENFTVKHRDGHVTSWEAKGAPELLYIDPSEIEAVTQR